MTLPSQIIDNENNFLDASLKVISRNQQWLHYHYHIFLFQKQTSKNK
jgi:signal-transduction protein with cAMP-binding, CBS, and nucleotidyltransferase domain